MIMTEYGQLGKLIRVISNCSVLKTPHTLLACNYKTYFVFRLSLGYKLLASVFSSYNINAHYHIVFVEIPISNAAILI